MDPVILSETLFFSVIRVDSGMFAQLLHLRRNDPLILRVSCSYNVQRRRTSVQLEPVPIFICTS